MNKKIIALRSPEESDDSWYYMYFEVPENFDLDVEKFEEDFRSYYVDDDEFGWSGAFDQTAKEYGLTKEVNVEVYNLSI